MQLPYLSNLRQHTSCIYERMSGAPCDCITTCDHGVSMNTLFSLCTHSCARGCICSACNQVSLRPQWAVQVRQVKRPGAASCWILRLLCVCAPSLAHDARAYIGRVLDHHQSKHPAACPDLMWGDVLALAANCSDGKPCCTHVSCPTQIYSAGAPTSSMDTQDAWRDAGSARVEPCPP